MDEGESPADAARREAFEEIGLDPALPRLVGALPPVHTYVSAILVVPFVGLLRLPPDLFAAEAEIKEIVRVPLARLATDEEPMELPRADGTVWHGWAYPLEGPHRVGSHGSDGALLPRDPPGGGTVDAELTARRSASCGRSWARRA